MMMRGQRRRASHDGCAPENDVAALQTDLTNLEVAVFGRLGRMEESNERLERQVAAMLGSVPPIRGALAAWLEVLADLDS